jgi:hypothetical protein
MPRWSTTRVACSTLVVVPFDGLDPHRNILLSGAFCVADVCPQTKLWVARVNAWLMCSTRSGRSLVVGHRRLRIRASASRAVSSAFGRVCSGDVGYQNCLNACFHGSVRRLTSAA